jgi:outer membrane cobalamin receptor
METGQRGQGGGARRGVERAPFASREIALLGLMAALWGVIEITVGGMIKGWHVPFGGSLLSTFGVVILLTARASVPRKWSSLLVGVVAAGIRFASGFGGAMFAAIGIVAEALIVEVVLSLMPPGQRARMLAGALAVLWALVHPFVIHGYILDLGPQRVYGFTIGLIAGQDTVTSGQVFLVILFLAIVHIALGVSAVMFVDRILLAPYTRARRQEGGGPEPERRRSGSSGSGPRTAALLVLAGVLLAASPCARAQQSESSRAASETGTGAAVYTLPEFHVFGSRLFGPFSVFQIDAGEILESGADDLAQALDLVPGMVVRTDSRGEARLSTRGLAEREIVVLVDGVPISDPYTGTVSSSMVLAGALGKVRVTKGPAASVYGANALGGVVEVATVAEERTGFEYRLASGSDGRHSGHLSGAGHLGPVHLSGGAATNSSADFTLPGSFQAQRWEDGGTREYSASEELFLWGRALLRPSPGLTTALSFQVADGRRDVPASTDAERPRFWRFPFWREVRTIGAIGWQPSGDLLVEGKVYYGTNDNQLAAYADAERLHRRWLSSVANRSFGGYVYGEYRGLGSQRLAGGLNVRRDMAGLRPDVGEDWSEYEATTMSAFGQDVVSLGDHDRVTFAVNTDVMGGEERFLLRVNPQAAWTHRLASGLSVRVLGGFKTRFPTLKEWFSPEIGNLDLKPERSRSIEVELARRTVGGSRFSVLAYEQWVDDMIVTAGAGDPARNLGAVRSRGAELGVDHRLGADLTVELSFAVTAATDVETGAGVPLVPKTMVSAAATYGRGPATILGRLTRVGTRAGLRGGSLPEYYLIDLRSTLETRWGDLFVGVENLFDVLYEDEEGFPQPGRAFEVGVSRSLYQ